MAQAFSRPTLGKVIEQVANRRYDELEFVRLSAERWRDLESRIGQWTKDQSFIGGTRRDPRGEAGIAHFTPASSPTERTSITAGWDSIPPAIRSSRGSSSATRSVCASSSRMSRLRGPA